MPRFPSSREAPTPWSTPTRLAALAAGRALALLPRRARFPATLMVARATAPVMVALLARADYRGVMQGRVDAMLRVLCRAMTAAGTRFDPRVRYDGPDEDLSGALLVSGHFPLNDLVSRYLFDRGAAPVVVKTFPDADPFYWGSGTPEEAIMPTPIVLVKVRNALAKGRTVATVVDMDDDVPRGVPVTTVYGTRHISTAVFDFARLHDVPVFFVCGRSERSGPPLVYVRRIEPDVHAFIAEYRAQAARIV